MAMVKITIRKATILLMALVLIGTMMPEIAYGTTGVEKQSTSGNLPSSEKETSSKWVTALNPDATTGFTPPLIVDDNIYTASGYYIYKVNKETGEKTAVSEKLSGSVGFAMNPLVYADGMIFALIGNGRVQALDAATLTSKWVSEAVGGQTISPLAYKDGCLYTGTWNSATKDGTYFCLTTQDEDTSSETETKTCKWKFSPEEVEGKERGFYWAGAYVGDGFVVFGSDDGTSDVAETSVCYSLDSATGQIIDRITGINGDIRTSMVYDNGYVYFTSNPGILYKAKIDGTGHFDQEDISSCALGGETTATPVIYGSRLYVGVKGTGGAYDIDGGHGFDVVNISGKLNESSVIYTASTPGYPQATALISTAEAGETGKVRVYFTCNARPGGIFSMEDKAGQTEGHVDTLFTPESDSSEYCISTLCADDEGTIYYTNDSKKLFAVGKNQAYLDDVQLSSEAGNLTWSSAFSPSGLSYAIKAATGTTAVKVKLTLPEGTTAIVDGNSYTDNMSVPMDSQGNKQLNIVVSKGGQSRNYRFDIKGLKSDATLTDLKFSTSNTYGAALIDMLPAFNSNITEYPSVNYTAGEREFFNVWPTAAEGASVKVYPISGVSKDRGISVDGTVTNVGSATHPRYAVYFATGKKQARIRVQVTSENGSAVKDYYATLIRTLPTDEEDITVNLSVLLNGKYVKGKNAAATLLCNAPVKVNYSDLAEWNIGQYSKTDESTGSITEEPTLLHLLLRSTGTYYLGRDMTSADIGTESLSLSGSQSTMRVSKLWGYTGDLYFYVNGVPTDQVNLKTLEEDDSVTVSSSGDYAFFTPNEDAVYTDKTITFTVKTGHDGQSSAEAAPASGAKIYISSDGGKNWQDTGKTTDANGKVALSFAAAGTYYVSVGKESDMVPGTAKVNVTTDPYKIDKPAGWKTALSTYGSSVACSWTASPQAEAYRLYYKKSTETSWHYYTVSGTTKTISGLAANTTYQFKARAYKYVNDTIVYSEYTAVSSQKTIGAPKSLSCKLTSYNGMKISWSSVSGAAGYRVYYLKGGTSTWYSKDTTATYINRASLYKGKTYYYKIRAYKYVSGVRKYSSLSAQVKATTLKAPTVSLTKSGTRSIKVKWTNIAGESGYQIYRSTGAGTYYKVKTLSSSYSSWLDTQKTKRRSYRYKVRAYTKVGTKYIYGPFSSAKKIIR